MFLIDTSKTLKAVLDAIPSAQWAISVGYADLMATSLTPGNQVSTTNSTTAVTILSAPAAATVRQVKYINILNTSNGSQKVTVSLDDAGSPTNLYSRIVPPGYTLSWTLDASWQVQEVPVTASEIANVPAGNLAATNVQDALNELDTEKVAKAGDTMTGQLIAAATGGTPLIARRTDDGNTGPIVIFEQVTASPAVNDRLAIQSFRSRDSAGNVEDYVQIRGIILDPTNGSEDGQYSIFNMVAGVQTQVLDVASGVIGNGATGGDQGLGTANFRAVYDDGVLICAPLQDVFGETTDQAFWDNVIPNHVIKVSAEYENRPAVLSDPDPKTGDRTVLLPAETIKIRDESVTVIETTHRTAKRYFDMKSDGFDATKPDIYFARLEADRAVPGMPTLDEHNQRYPVVDGVRTAVDKYGIHERTERSALALDFMALTIRTMYEEQKQLRATVEALQARLSQMPGKA